MIRHTRVIPDWQYIFYVFKISASMTNYLQKFFLIITLWTKFTPNYQQIFNMHTQLLHLLPLLFQLSQRCNLSLSLPSFFPPSLSARVLAAADIWSGCLVIDGQVMRRLKGRWRQEQVFGTVFLAGTKLPCPSLLHRATPSFFLSFFPSFLRSGLCNPSHGDTVGRGLSL